MLGHPPGTGAGPILVRGEPRPDEVIEFCLDHTGPLAIQAVHDYVNSRYWTSYAGWQDATNSASTGFGQSWAQWLHIERL